MNLDASDHTVVVVLADARMTRQFDDETRATFQAWKSIFDEGLQRASVERSPHHVFAVAVGDGFALASEEHMLSVSEPPSRHATEDEKGFQR